MVATLTDRVPLTGRTPLASSLTLAGLCLLVWGVTTEVHLGLGGRHLAALVSLVVASVGWVVWEASLHLHAPALKAAALVTMGVAGGALAPFASLASVFVGVAALGATIAWDLQVAMWVALSGPAAMAVALPVAGRDATSPGTAAAAVVAGAAIGISRRESAKTVDRAAQVRVAEAQAEAERAKAELLAGRNHMARELHDVLAHTLSALSLQLEALDTVVSAGGPPNPEVQEQLEVTKRLVRAGLEEARGAVRALREDAPPLGEQLKKLAADRGATLEVRGAPRPLGADVSLALYRAAQEGLTNVAKHAPGATAEVDLEFEDHSVWVSVTNGPSHGEPSPLSNLGGGYGIQGIEERLLLLGGRVHAGPAGDGWRLVAEVQV